MQGEGVEGRACRLNKDGSNKKRWLSSFVDFEVVVVWVGLDRTGPDWTGLDWTGRLFSWPWPTLQCGGEYRIRATMVDGMADETRIQLARHRETDRGRQSVGWGSGRVEVWTGRTALGPAVLMGDCLWKQHGVEP